MDISYMLEFVTLAETKKYRAAASKLHISQSTLSRHIQTLEQELGCALFSRSTREVKLTECGKIYLPFAKKIANEHQKALSAIMAHEREKKSIVRVGMVHNPELYNAIQLVLAFQREHSDIPVHLAESSLHDLYAAYKAGQLNLVSAAYADWETAPANFIPIGKSRLMAILPADHLYAAYQKIQLSALEQVKLIVPEEKEIMYRYLIEMLEREGIRPNIFYQGNTSGVSALLAENMAILIQDISRAKMQLADDLVLRELTPPIVYTFGLEYRDSLSKNEKAFVDFVREAAQAQMQIYESKTEIWTAPHENGK